MCLLNYTINENKNKTMSENELGKIEILLDEGYNAKQIGIKIERDSSAIRKEINKYKVYNGGKKACYKCKNYSTCSERQLCGSEMTSNLCTRCKDCQIALEHCTRYVPKEVTCKKLKGQRKVCNGCKEMRSCKKTKAIYNSKEAIKKHKINQRNSVKK